MYSDWNGSSSNTVDSDCAGHQSIDCQLFGSQQRSTGLSTATAVQVNRIGHGNRGVKLNQNELSGDSNFAGARELNLHASVTSLLFCPSSAEEKPYLSRNLCARELACRFPARGDSGLTQERLMKIKLLLSKWTSLVEEAAFSLRTRLAAKLSEPPPRRLRLKQLEERVMMSAAPVPVEVPTDVSSAGERMRV